MVTRTPTRYTPRNRAELVSCLIGSATTSPVGLKPDAAKLLRRRFRTRTVKDVLGLPTWPYGRLRIVIQRRALIEVVIEPA
jgi:hypothetical protein